MEASIFKNLIVKYFGQLSKAITEKINGAKKEIVFEYKKYLRNDLSTDMKFNSITSNTSVVAADVVALDSELPLKQRGSYSSATGEIPKIGMKKFLTESMLQAIQNMIARGSKEGEVAKKLFRDLADSVKGVHERIDIMFLQALSTGVTLIDENTNTGTGIRIDFGLPTENQFGATGKAWTDADATPIDDIDNVRSNARAKGDVLRYIFMDDKTFNLFKKNQQVKDAFAGANRITKELVFRLSTEDVQEFLSSEYGMQIIVVDKVVQIEKGGKKTGYSPWQEGNVTFTTTMDLGTLTYGELAESKNRVSGVEYQIVDTFILASMYRTNDPLKETTSVQALAIPVIDNIDSIYIMDTNESTASESTQTEGDSDFDYNGEEYTIASVVAGINAARAVDTQVAKATTSQTDATLAKKIDSLSEAGIELFEAELVESGS